ncbi:hypothetical protein BHE74_00036953 [Ensete ventricosum]|uniref:Uncharacterized protein n=1 Tax=Ensete ventricosum TaxID=4639 RepID=A0A444E2Y3_ENSVE|nr:hypothetical protein B296_00015429 [Ensete ventricosum]RWW04742.1 hypothetical protein GW17_00032012 [Ensete ventricosum]RWW56338.1 hypothetical protein BHE74_00036953 [Ensete ventricosum]RZS04652.1 hypothetical protein BHM03_00035007 [Ensete ventricosum]
MQTEARVGVVVEGGGHRTLSSGHAGGAGALDGGARRYSSHQPRQQQQQLQHQPQIGTVAHLIAGGVAGAVSKTCTAPLARLTILFQGRSQKLPVSEPAEQESYGKHEIENLSTS